MFKFSKSKKKMLDKARNVLINYWKNCKYPDTKIYIEWIDVYFFYISYFIQSKSGLITLVDLNVTAAMICSTSALHFENFLALFRNQANICDWAFIAKIISR